MRFTLLHAVCVTCALAPYATAAAADFEYVRTWNDEGKAYMGDKYFSRLEQGAGLAQMNSQSFQGLGVSYETCRTFCLDGGSMHGYGRCDAFLWAPHGCLGWQGTKNIAALCLLYDGDNHGRAMQVDISLTPC